MHYLFRFLSAVFATALLSLCNSFGIEGAADNVVLHPGEVFNTAAAHQNQGVLLKIMLNSGDVSGDFLTASQADAGDFP